MAKKYTNVQELIQDSIKLEELTEVTYPRLGETEILDPGYAAKFNGCYASNNSTLAYVVDKVLYVTPHTRAASACLRAAGFKTSSFGVPFSNGDYPTNEKNRWDSIRKMAKEEYDAELVEDCIAFSNEHGFGELSEQALSKCFKMPKNGIKVRHCYRDYETVYYPEITTSLDCVASEKIGSFDTNNGKVAFVYRDGNTYVAKGYKIVDELRQAGYKEKGLFVPFSNGEIIIDPVLAKQWENI